MTVDVTEEGNSSGVKSFDNHGPSGVDLGVVLIRRVLPLSVKIVSSNRAAVVANDDSIWIEHWDNFENKLVSELLSVRIIADKELNNSFHNETCVTFTRMHSRADNNC